jgi:hypothetical protein
MNTAARSGGRAAVFLSALFKMARRQGARETHPGHLAVF